MHAFPEQRNHRFPELPPPDGIKDRGPFFVGVVDVDEEYLQMLSLGKNLLPDGTFLI
jgi:hypothetical protein